MFELRDYQIQLLDLLRQSIGKGHKRILAQAPTGAGKTVIMGELCRSAVSKGKRVFIGVHRDTLVTQTCDKLSSFSVPWGIVQGSVPPNRDAPVQVGMLQSIDNVKHCWFKEQQFDIYLWDEAHLSCWFRSAQNYIFEYHPTSIHIGVTATPNRTSPREGMADVFQDLVWSVTPADLQSRGYLAPMKYYSLSKIDFSKVRTFEGEFNTKDLKVACDRPELIQLAVSEWEDKGQGKPTLAFCVSIEHAEHMRDAFRAAGYRSEAIHSKITHSDKELIERFKAGEIDVLTSVGKIDVGFDAPNAVCAILARPTQSEALYMQQLGRVMRVCEGKEYGIVLDLAGNCLRMDLLPEEVVSYSLSSGTDRPKAKVSRKECPSCHSLIPNFAQECPECGYVFVFSEEKKLILSGPLTEIKTKSDWKGNKQASEYRSYILQAYRRNHRPGRAAYRFKEKYGRWPSYNWALHTIFDNPTPEDMQTYFDYLKYKQLPTDNPGWLTRAFKSEFGNTPEVQKWLAALIVPGRYCW